MTKKIKPKAKPHYVNNRDFSLAVVEYVKSVHVAKDAEKPIPKVTDYVATCFMKISEGLSHRPNFVRYTYKIETATRTGNPNAFSYFTQICFFAFIRRITKEKKQQDIKFRFIERMGIEDFAQMGMDEAGAQQTMEYVDTLRQRIDQIRTKDEKIKEFAKIEKEKEKLELFMV